MNLSDIKELSNLSLIPENPSKPILSPSNSEKSLNSQTVLSPYSAEVLEVSRMKLIKSKVKEYEKLILNETFSTIKSLTQNMRKTLKEIKSLNKNLKSFKELSRLLINEEVSKRIKADILNLYVVQKNKTQSLQNPYKNFKSSKLYDFKWDTNTLFSFNSETEEYSSTSVPSLTAQGLLSVIFQVSPDKLFLYGGWTSCHQYLKTAYFIDLIDFTARQLPDGLVRSHASGELVGDKIYVFGGSNGNEILSDCNVFNLSTERWEQIQKLPYPNYCTSTLLINQSILVSGHGSSLFSKYKIESDCFESLNSGFDIPAQNILVCHCEKVFLLSYYSSYEAGTGDLRNWTLINSLNNSCFGNITTSKPVVRGDRVFFIVLVNRVVSFNCVTYEFREIITMDSN